MDFQMVMNTGPSSKYQLLAKSETPAPAFCAYCRNGNCEEGYVNTGFYVDDFGLLLVCVPCLKEMSIAIGCMPPEVYHQVVKDQTQLANNNVSLIKRVETLEGALNAARSSGTGSINIDADLYERLLILPVLQADLSNAEAPEQPITDEPEASGEAGSNDSVDGESVTSDGPDDSDELTDDDLLAELGIN